MTFLEKAKEDNKQFDISKLKHICPEHIGLENDSPCEIYKGNCEMCWNREMPNAEPTPKEDMDREDYMNLGYNKGLNDAWEFMKKFCAMTHSECMDIFQTSSARVLLDRYTPQEALAKLKAYEEAQIEVGDVVKLNGTNYTYVVTVIQEESDGTYYCGLSKNGRWFAQNNVTKTGKHIEVANILEQIGE